MSTALAITIVQLPYGLLGSWYSGGLTCNGLGMPPYVWSLTHGVLPKGLHMTADGGIFGTPAVVAIGVQLGVMLQDSGADSSGRPQVATAVVGLDILSALPFDPANPNLQFHNADF
jgi:hypothetical protein